MFFLHLNINCYFLEAFYTTDLKDFFTINKNNS